MIYKQLSALDTIHHAVYSTPDYMLLNALYCTFLSTRLCTLPSILSITLSRRSQDALKYAPNYTRLHTPSLLDCMLQSTLQSTLNCILPYSLDCTLPSILPIALNCTHPACLAYALKYVLKTLSSTLLIALDCALPACLTVRF